MAEVVDMKKKIIIAIVLALFMMIISGTFIYASQASKLDKFNEGKKLYSVTYENYQVKAKHEDKEVVKYASKKPKINQRKNDSVEVDWDTDYVTVTESFVMQRIWQRRGQ